MLSPTGGMLPSSVRAFQLPEFAGETGEETREEIGAATVAAAIASASDDDEQIVVRIELGRTRLPRDDVRRLRNGSVVSLDGRIDEPVDIRVGGRLIGRGDVMVLDGKISVRVVELFREEASP
jgi:flagellar motor switch protein FliN/FliY